MGLLLALLFVACSLSEERVRLVVAITRHGAREPSRLIKESFSEDNSKPQ